MVLGCFWLVDVVLRIDFFGNFLMLFSVVCESIFAGVLGLFKDIVILRGYGSSWGFVWLVTGWVDCRLPVLVTLLFSMVVPIVGCGYFSCCCGYPPLMGGLVDLLLYAYIYFGDYCYSPLLTPYIVS